MDELRQKVLLLLAATYDQALAPHAVSASCMYRVLYVVNDITSLVNKSGTNVIAVMLGGGWYTQGQGGTPALFLELSMSSGGAMRPLVISASSGWTVGRSYILADR